MISAVVSALASFIDVLSSLSGEKSFPIQVTFGYDIYHSNRNHIKTIS